MADFNKITVNSSLTVIPADFASLCFNDGILISKNKYGIADNTLNLMVDTTDTVSIFSNNGIANTYEFNYIRLNNPGTVLPKLDINNQQVENLSQNKILVFVNGKLQPSSAYTVVDENTLKFNINYTNDYNELFNVIIYVSTVNFQRIVYTKQQLQTQYDLASETDQSDLNQNRLVLPVRYEYKNTLLFTDGIKIGFNAIDVLNENSTSVQLNIPEKIIGGIDTFEIVKFTDNKTSSINFTTRQGYLTYGPYDDLGKKIPNTYNVIFRFTDQTKLLIDNIRPGFILKEVDGYGEAVIVDTVFESMEVKALSLQPFPYSSYTSSMYYVEVPEYTSIINYLAEFDKKYTFLPEILEVFQRLLLDEINDTIQRLREARSISRVDSVHINKLIKLLGFNINIKQLNKKQRRELIEELNEFYRIAGTRNSYNLINILQNNLKLISADQLFTPSGLTKRKNQTLYTYDIKVAEDDQGNPEGGDGYAVNDALVLENSGLVAKITDIDVTDPQTNTGSITGVALETSEGYKEINQTFTMQSILNGTFKVDSSPNLYAYNWTTSDSTHCTAGTVLQSGEKKYGIRVTGANNGEITSFVPYNCPHDANEDKIRVDFNKLQLYRLINDFNATVTYTPIYRDDLNYGSPIYTCRTGGQEFSVFLEPGVYYVRIAGAGGAGGAADSVRGNEWDLPAYNGSNGEYLTKYFTVSKSGLITGKVGQGGGKAKGRGHDAQPYNTVAGNGFNNGKLGQMANLQYVIKKGTHYNNSNSYYVSRDKWYSYGNAAAGQGGGSTGLRGIDGELIVEARGGNGGNAEGKNPWTPKYYSESFPTNVTVLYGGQGGGGGISGGSPLAGAGGERAKGGDFWSKNGGDGWIEIYRLDLDYHLTLNGDLSTAGSEVWETVESIPGFQITTTSEGGVTTYDYTPKIGKYGCEGTFNLKSGNADATAKLSISSTVSLWDYYVKLSADSTHISRGSTFINQDSAPEEQFVFTVTKNQSTEGTWTPTQGTEKIVLNGVSAYTRHGDGAIVEVSSRIDTQKNEDRCYIDFYKKEELGAEPVLEFRPNTIEYGTITEGTPNSPKFWEVGLPDIEYGTIEIDPPTDVIKYGKVDESTEGEWAEYWIWNRETNWYPTNHVDLEMKLPPGVNFSEYVDTFVEQFYNLASTVVYIHQITESFYFGNDTNTSYNTTVSTKEDLVGDPGVMAAPFGIVSTMPLMEYEATVTSDPDKQYINPVGYYFDVTIIPMVPDATVKVITENISSTGAVIKTVTPLVETENWTTQIQYGTTITYIVEAPGYVTKGATLTVDTNIIKHVMLESETPSEPKYCMFKIKTLPLNANVTFTVGDVTTTKSHTIYAWDGNTIFYTVSYPGYTTVNNSIVITDNTTLEIKLTPES